MPATTEPIYSTDKTLPVLGTVYTEDLHITIDLGRFYIPPKNAALEAKVSQSILDNIYHENPGGVQGKSFVNPDVRQKISESFVSTGHGIMPRHIEIKGAPYCTFLDVCMGANETHPYYDFINSPLDLPVINYNSALTFNLNQPLDIPFSSGNGNDISNNPQYLSPVNIPATSFTEPEVKKLKDDEKLINLTSYNYWTVSNIVESNFNIKKYSGYDPKNSINVSNAQPYAYVNNDSETSSITVVASNSIAILTRKYPMRFDFAHQKNSKYYYLDNSNSKNELVTQDINLFNGDSPVGFCIKFENIVTFTSQNVLIKVGDKVGAKQPEIWIQWGDLDFAKNEKIRDKYAKTRTIGLYTLYLNSTDPVRLFFNKSNTEITSDSVNPLSNNITLNNLPNLPVGAQSNEKTSLKLEIYVFYSGQYMYIGSNGNSHEWQQIGKPRLDFSNVNVALQNEFKHNLDKNSQIQIIAKGCNFVFKYGPPLFMNIDKNNVPEFTKQEPVDQRNYFSSRHFVANSSKEAIEYIKRTPDFIKKNSIPTFQEPNTTRYINASAYTDARSINAEFSYGYQQNDYDENYQIVDLKITTPNDLGGHVFNKLYTQEISQEPAIEESYVKYDLIFSKSEKSVSDILTQSLVSATLNKKIESDGVSITGDLKLTFVNLNRTDEGYNLLQWMRKNISVIRLKAGYGGDAPVWAEAAITTISIQESLDQTTIIVETEDLLSYLFKTPKTKIISRSGYNFPGMKFRDIINSLVERTELKNHFKYELGANLDSWLKNSNEASLPPMIDTNLIPNLALLRVLPYDTENSYFKVLQQVCQLCIISKLRNYDEISKLNNSGEEKDVQDVAVMYWEAYEDNGPKDGIVFSSRFDGTNDKDKDTFYFRKKNISLGLTTQIKEIHGYLIGSDGTNYSFQSSSNAANLYYEGIYYYQDPQQRQEIINVPKFKKSFLDENYKKALQVDEINPAITPYIGYDKIVNFSDESKPGDAAQLSPLLFPRNKKFEVENIIENLFNYFCAKPYETINLKAYVTKPLKHWGHFTIALENDESISDKYLYSVINYEFKIFENLIEATVTGARNPVIDQS